jgi:hypothetical protein
MDKNNLKLSVFLGKESLRVKRAWCRLYRLKREKQGEGYSAASLAPPFFRGFPSIFFNTGARNFPV